MALSDLEKQVIAAIQGDLPVSVRPFQPLAEEVGIDEATFLQVLRDLQARGVIRRFGATLRHQQSGYQANVMVAWQVEETRIQEIGALMASFQAVSHCYRRDPQAQWPYNLYTMVHGRNDVECRRTVTEMAAKSGVTNYAMLFSKRELKKISMTYFGSPEAGV